MTKTKNEIKPINRYTGNEFKYEEEPYHDRKITVECIKDYAQYGQDLLFYLSDYIIGTDGMIEYDIDNDIATQRFYQFADMDAYNEFKKVVYPIAMKYRTADEKKILDQRMEREYNRLNNKPIVVDMPKVSPTIKLDEKLVRMISDLLFARSVMCGRLQEDDFLCLKKVGYDTASVLHIMGNNGFLHNMFDKYQLSVAPQPILPRLIISGGINPKYKQDNEETKFCKMLYTMGGKYDWNDVLTKPEAVIINERLQKCSNNPWTGERAPLLETKSLNFKDHFVNVDKLGGYKDVEQLRIVTTAESALRAVATARKQLPKINDIEPLSYVATFPQMNLICDKEHWANHPLSQQYVCAELAKVAEYNNKGDIELTYREEKKLRDIVELLKQKQR